MRLAHGDGSPMPLARALLLSASWGVGAAIGVALGAVLTAVSGAGAPGASAVEPVSDLIVVPLLAGSVVFLVHLGVTLGVASIRARRARERDAQGHERGEGEPDDRVER